MPCYLKYFLEFGVKYVIFLNEKKSVCLHFNDDDSDNPDILLIDKYLIWKSSVKNLGNVVNHNILGENHILLYDQDVYN